MAEKTPTTSSTRSHETLLRLMAEESSAVIWSTDAELRLTYFFQPNPTSTDRVSRDDTGMPLAEFFDIADDDSPVIDAHQRALSGESVHIDLDWDGNKYKGRVTAQRDESGEIIGCMGCAHGVSGGGRDTDLDHLFNLSQQMLCIAGTDGHFKRLNPAFEKTLGYDRNELLARPFVHFVHPDDRKATLEELRKLSEGTPTVYFENRYRCKDGSYRWLAWTSAPEHNELLFASAVDVTEHKHTEEMFRTLLESAPDATIITNRKGEIVLVNAVTESLFGFSREEMIGQSIELVVPPRLREIHRKHLKNYFADPKVREMGAGIELSSFRKDGTEFPSEISLGPLVTEKGIFVFCAIRDITKRKRQEMALRRSEERFDLAVQGTDSGIFDWDLKTNHVYFSPRWKSMLGHEEDEISDDYFEWEKRLHPDDREHALATIRAYLEGKSPEYELEHRLRHKNGSYRWILARGAAVRDKDGIPYRMVGSQIDITERKAAERTARAREAELIAAKGIQQRLLPQHSPSIPGFDIAGIAYPAEFAAGDHYYYYTMNDGSVAFAVSDVTGHGISSALLAAGTHAYLYSLTKTDTNIASILTGVNSFLFGETDVEKFVTLIIARIDCEARELHYGNAGHPAGIVLDSTGEVKARLESTGIPLAVTPNAEYAAGPPVRIEAGDTVLLVSDGVLEAESRSAGFFGEGRTLRVIRENIDRPAKEILDCLYEELRTFTHNAKLEDDVTAVLIKCERDRA